MWHHPVLRTNASGNFFRTLLRQLTIDPAMLNYLDGDPWVATAPTRTTPVRPWSCSWEPRQLQTKTEVRNGAKALVGWEVSGDVLESQ